MEKTNEDWGIKVDGIQLPGFSSQEEAETYITEKLQGKDAIAFQFQTKASLSHPEEDYTGLGIA